MAIGALGLPFCRLYKEDKTMKLTVKRIYKGNNYTIGHLYIDDVYFSDVLEDKVRELNKLEDKVYGKTAIPEGVYQVKLTFSPKFKKILPEILNVPFFSGIRIHSGNTADDSEGCLLVGENKVKGKVINSKKTIEKLMKILKSAQDPIFLQIA